LLDAKRFNRRRLGSEETKRKEDELSGEDFLGTRNFFHLPTPTAVLRPLYAHCVKAFEFTLFVENEFLGGDTVFARVCKFMSVNERLAWRPA
jgi:hypothetical protein